MILNIIFTAIVWLLGISNNNINNSNLEINTNTMWINNIQELNISSMFPETDLIANIKTNKWSIKIKLYTKDAPITVANFVWLANSNYYDKVIFHRIIKDFMIQWWDPLGNWTGWKSLFWDKFLDEFSDKLKNNKYTISMANAWANTNWSQFFINTNNNNFLDNKHAVFWEVIDGKDIVEIIQSSNTNNNDKPIDNIIILDIKILNEWKEFKLDIKEAKENYEKFKKAKSSW